MTKKRIEAQCDHALLGQIDELLRKRTQLLHDLIEVLARSLARIERRLDEPGPAETLQSRDE